MASPHPSQLGLAVHPVEFFHLLVRKSDLVTHRTQCGDKIIETHHGPGNEPPAPDFKYREPPDHGVVAVPVVPRSVLVGLLPSRIRQDERTGFAVDLGGFDPESHRNPHAYVRFGTKSTHPAYDHVGEHQQDPHDHENCDYHSEQDQHRVLHLDECSQESQKLIEHVPVFRDDAHQAGKAYPIAFPGSTHPRQVARHPDRAKSTSTYPRDDPGPPTHPKRHHARALRSRGVPIHQRRS